MEFTIEEPKVRFTVVDRPTVRQQLTYRGALGLRSAANFYIKLWEAAQVLIEEWECEDIPDRGLDLDGVEDPSIADIVQWVGVRVMTHMNELEDIPKN